MRAVILAAGAGRRLRAVAGAAPKCLVPIGGMPLLEWQLQALEMCGAEEITVVVGYQAEAIQAVCGARADFVYNPDFASTNSLYSLWLARHLLGNGCVILNSDVLFHPELLARLLEAPHELSLIHI